MWGIQRLFIGHDLSSEYDDEVRFSARKVRAMANRSMIVNSVFDLIGNTPMLRLCSKNQAWEYFLKLEKWNPGQSMKDRAVLSMIQSAEVQGRLKPGGTIVESSSGNTAIGLAIMAAVKGYKFLAVMDHHAPVEKVNMIRAYGGEIVFVDSPLGMEEGLALDKREKLASELAHKTPNAIYIEQHHNPANTHAYPTTLAREIIGTIPDLDLFFAAIGTTGSICGTSKGFKAVGRNIRVIAVEPKVSIFFSDEGAPYFQSGTGNPMGAELPRILDRSLIDEGLQVTDTEAFACCRALARRFGLLLGGSAGGVMYRALDYTSAKGGSGKAVILACDGGEKYLSTIYNDDWMRENGLLAPELELEVETSLTHPSQV